MSSSLLSSNTVLVGTTLIGFKGGLGDASLAATIFAFAGGDFFLFDGLRPLGIIRSPVFELRAIETGILRAFGIPEIDGSITSSTILSPGTSSKTGPP